MITFKLIDSNMSNMIKQNKHLHTLFATRAAGYSIGLVLLVVLFTIQLATTPLEASNRVRAEHCCRVLKRDRSADDARFVQELGPNLRKHYRWRGVPELSETIEEMIISRKVACESSEPCQFQIDWDFELESSVSKLYKFELDEFLVKTFGTIPKNTPPHVRKARTKGSLSCRAAPGRQAYVVMRVHLLKMTGRMAWQKWRPRDDQNQGPWLPSDECGIEMDWQVSAPIAGPNVTYQRPGLPGEATYRELVGDRTCRDEPIANLQTKSFDFKPESLSDEASEALEQLTSRLVEQPPMMGVARMLNQRLSGDSLWVRGQCYNHQNPYTYTAICRECMRHLKLNIMSKAGGTSLGADWRVADCSLRYELFDFRAAKKVAQYAKCDDESPSSSKELANRIQENELLGEQPNELDDVTGQMGCRVDMTVMYSFVAGGQLTGLQQTALNKAASASLEDPPTFSSLKRKEGRAQGYKVLVRSECFNQNARICKTCNRLLITRAVNETHNRPAEVSIRVKDCYLRYQALQSHSLDYERSLEPERAQNVTNFRADHQHPMAEDKVRVYWKAVGNLLSGELHANSEFKHRDAIALESGYIIRMVVWCLKPDEATCRQCAEYLLTESPIKSGNSARVRWSTADCAIRYEDRLFDTDVLPSSWFGQTASDTSGNVDRLVRRSQVSRTSTVSK